MTTKYEVNNRLAGSQQSCGTSYKTIVSTFSTTGSLRRGKVVEWVFGADGAPNATDCQIVYDISRMTADGTATAATPNPQDSADVACLTTSKVNYTAEPTVTAASSLKTIALNQRATQRWVGGPDDLLMWPSTANNGLVYRALSPTYAANILMQVTFVE